MNNKSQFKPGHEPWNKNKKSYLTLEPSLRDEILQAYASGLTVKECVKKFQLSHWTIYELVKSENMIRSTGFYLKGQTRDPEIGKKISKARMGHSVNQNTRDAVSKANKKRTQEALRIQVTKAWITKKLNQTCNTSKPEEDFYQQLLSEHKDKTIYRQYKDPRYPFYCDFYIVEDDLFIELNAHWTHGGKPFNPDDPDCIETLKIWKQKAENSKFYAQAIYVWTQLDVKKRDIAMKNNLNYKVIY